MIHRRASPQPGCNWRGRAVPANIAPDGPLQALRKKSKSKPRKAAGRVIWRPLRPPGELVIITGMSGSGKASVLKAFEDLGYYCVDNLPVELIPRFAELVGQSSEISRTALVVDVREGSQLESLPAIVNSVKRMLPTKVIFLEAAESILLRRFSETRRPHPLGTRHAGEVVTGRRAPPSPLHPRHGGPGDRYLQVQCS